MRIHLQSKEKEKKDVELKIHLQLKEKKEVVLKKQHYGG